MGLDPKVATSKSREQSRLIWKSLSVREHHLMEQNLMLCQGQILFAR